MSELLPLERSLERWQNSDPKAMATCQSTAAIQIAFEDAKHDIRVLAAEITRLKAQPVAPVLTHEQVMVAWHAYQFDQSGDTVHAMRAALEAALAQPGEEK